LKNAQWGQKRSTFKVADKEDVVVKQIRIINFFLFLFWWLMGFELRHVLGRQALCHLRHVSTL
jgi:hypothetical protein